MANNPHDARKEGNGGSLYPTHTNSEYVNYWLLGRNQRRLGEFIETCGQNIAASLTPSVPAAGLAQQPDIHVGPRPDMLPSFDDSGISYDPGSRPRPVLHIQWWLDSDVFTAWENLGEALVRPSWLMRIGFGLTAGLLALVAGGTLFFVVLAGGIAGMFVPMLLGRLLLLLRVGAAGGLTVLAWMVVIGALGLVLVICVRALDSKPTLASQPTVTDSQQTSTPGPIQSKHRRKVKGEASMTEQQRRASELIGGWTPPKH